MNIFFTSDTHFSHANIIKYCNRPWASFQEMDEALVNNWNAIVHPNDIIYHLGDFQFKESGIAKRLKGRKCLVLGNHDKSIDHNLFEWVKPYYELKEHNIVLFHFPIESWNKKHHGSIHLHGHCHGSLKSEGIKRLDVGVDCTNYKPISLDEILLKFK